MKILIIATFLFSFSFYAIAGESFVPLQKGVRMASDDLVYNNNVLSSREAQDIWQFQKVDLSLLNPRPNDFWRDHDSSFNDQNAIALKEGESLTFQGGLSSNSGLYRFNAIGEDRSKIYTVHLDKTLHSLLLRKNLLRRLGYSVPAIKYLKSVYVNFSSNEELEKFLKKEIPEGTDGASSRWVRSIENLRVELQDIAITTPSETDFYNPAMGVPLQTINSRTLRSLVIPYSLVDLGESIESFNWIVGRVDNRAIVLPHFTANDFYVAIEDAQWMLRRLSQLSRLDFQKIVNEAYFPPAEAAVLLEKLISRRNSLNRVFNERSEEMRFDSNLTIGESVIKGKILEKSYPGYASRFSYGDPESPFEQLRYFLYAKLQGNVIDNLVNKFNSYLVAGDLNKLRSKYFQKQFEDGLKHFLETGEIEPIGIGTWGGISGNAQLIFSRDIVLGNYLGTDNLVQLADTFGASLDLGYHLGIEGLGNNLAGSVGVNTAIVRTFTHLKPVKSLKTSLKEPYKNIFVNLLKRSLKDRFFALSELKDPTIKSDEKTKKIQELFNEINRYLDTGESLLMTDRFMPSTDIKLNFNLGLVGAGLGTRGSVTAVRRIQVFKKSPKVLQIYDDHGFVKEIAVNYQFNKYIPILKLSGKYDSGRYNIKSYMIDLAGDLEKNPALFSNAFSVYQVLKNRNFEFLEDSHRPVELEAKFTDKSSYLSFLFFRLKRLKEKTYFNLKAKEGINGNYFSYTKDFLTGINIEALSKQILNYYLAENTNGTSLTVEGDINPGDSFFGRSNTQNIRFEAEVDENKKFEHQFISLSDSKQGWALSAKKLKKMMMNVNDKFQAILFDVNQINFEKLRLFKVGYHVNLYDRGIERLNSIRRDELDIIEERYQKERGCNNVDDKTLHSPRCEDLGALKLKAKKCQKSNTEEERAICNVELIDDLFTRLEFGDFKNIIGENNMYVYGTINGFRQKSEILNNTIYSNTIGKIGSANMNGPIDVVRELLGLSGGEFVGAWMRESL
ncbi:MAG: hypothetical protein KBD76_06985 [Bacteriovorax sp.]|nr:hypothetical protein [Bacteriovorax sp.]